MMDTISPLFAALIRDAYYWYHQSSSMMMMTTTTVEAWADDVAQNALFLQELPLMTPHAIMAVSAVLVLLFLATALYASGPLQRKETLFPPSTLIRLIQLKNRAICLFSIGLSLAIVPLAMHGGRLGSARSLVCDRPALSMLRHPNPYQLFLVIVYYSKLVEFLDLWLLQLAGAPAAHAVPFVVHHLTTPFLFWMLAATQTGADMLTVGINAVWHAAMYGHFGGWWHLPRRVSMACIAFQYVMGVMVSVWVLWQRWMGHACVGRVSTELVLLGLYGLYGVTFACDTEGKEEKNKKNA